MKERWLSVAEISEMSADVKRAPVDCMSRNYCQCFSLFRRGGRPLRDGAHSG